MIEALDDAIRDLLLWADQQPELAPELRRRIERLREARADRRDHCDRYGWDEE